MNAHQVRDTLQRVVWQANVRRQVFVLVERGVADAAQQRALLLGVAAPAFHEVEEELQRDAPGFGDVELFTRGEGWG